MKEFKKEQALLNEEWDLDPSASDNESYEIEMALEESINDVKKQKDSPENKH